MRKTNPTRLAQVYWNSLKETPPQLVGMTPLGGGGVFEAPYRHYFEFRHLKRIVAFRKSMNVVELGSGNGRWATSIAPLVGHYDCVDLSETGMQIARESVKAKGLSNVDFHIESIVDFSGDRVYDVIYFSGVSQFLTDDQIREVLANLSEWVGQNTIIVDRSTITFDRRTTMEAGNYYSIYRTPDEIKNIFGNCGYQIEYQNATYRFLRCARAVGNPKIRQFLASLVIAAQPISFYLMLLFSYVADTLSPSPVRYEGLRQSHDFFKFKKSEKVFVG
jgi:2-polyprenyl-3-methyl-5-hydroxy-6-metoxy-1,4-benzoquinol methylase